MDRFGELVLVIGDLHIPNRADKLPFPFLKMLIPNKMNHLVCTGNLCTERELGFFKSLTPNFIAVGGQYDVNLNLPASNTCTISNYKIAVVNGHELIPPNDLDLLEIEARRLNADILISGFTHQPEVRMRNHRLFVNPGSATGAFSSFSEDVVPSFMLLDIKKERVVVFQYRLVDGKEKVEVTKTEFRKTD